MVRSPRSIGDYDAVFDPIRQRRQEASGKQLGDPDKAANAMLEIIESVAPPSHLVLGSDALGLIRQKIAELQAELTRWEAVTRSTDGGSAANDAQVPSCCQCS